MTTEQITHDPPQVDAAAAQAGKYLTFSLAQEEYGLEILKVREINGYMDITAVPQTPPTSRVSSI